MRRPPLVFTALVLPLSLVSCADRGNLLEPQDVALATAPVVGTYQLTVTPATDLGGGTWEVQVNTPFFLVAQVAFPGGDPVTKGTAVFESFFGGRWHRILSVPVDQDGEARWDLAGVGFCDGVPLPLARFKYTGQGSGVKNGLSNSVTVRTAPCG